MLIRFMVFGALGWIMEILWTGLFSLMKKDFRLMGTTSIWMFFIYGLVGFMAPLCVIMHHCPMWVRGGCYALLIFTVEYVTGRLIKIINSCPWDYSDSRFSVQGIIRLDYAPIWFTVGLFFEQVHAYCNLFF